MSYLKYLAFILLFLSVAFYFFGYVPRTTYENHDFKRRSYFKKQTIDKVVLIVIDSLRPDMIFKKRYLWPNLYSTINKSWTYVTSAKLQPPSMSLPKIKCIITGAVVGFIDVIFNTDSGQIKQDNLIDILIEYRQFVINFYGDTTWLKLFPKQFTFKDPTTPFFVNDYFQVDRNVSRNIPNILLSDSLWNMTIIHYLGLDHIGHAEGPFAKATYDKLVEMDNITGTLINGLLQKPDSDKTLIILTADHGMSNLGGHGGSSPNEINVPLIFVNKNFQNSETQTSDFVSQNDIAPSLALLLGVPIPADNIGVIPHNVLSLINHPMDQTQALISNYLQLRKIMSTIPESIIIEFSKINSSILKLHDNCSSNYSSKCIKNLSYQHLQLINLMKSIKDILINQFVQHNFMLLEIAHFMSIISCFVSIVVILTNWGIHVSIAGTCFTLSVSWILLSLLYQENLTFCAFKAFKLSLSGLLVVLTCHTLSGAKQFMKSVIPADLENISSRNAILLSLIINIFGSSVPSYIKEENEVWFYLNNTLLILHLINEFISKTIINNEPFSVYTTYFACSVILVTDRFLRTLNRSGELWSDVPDLGDWFVQIHSMYLLAAIGICLPIVAILHWDRESIFLSFLTMILVTLNGIHRYADIEGYRMISDMSVWIYDSLLILKIVLHIIFKKVSFTKATLKMSEIIFFGAFIICRHQNVLLWAGIAIKRLCFRKLWTKEIRGYPIIFQFIIFNSIGMATYFQQGNSNSLTTLDVQPGFVGMRSFIPIIIFPMVAIHTFSGNLYWIILWLEWLSERCKTIHCNALADSTISQSSDKLNSDVRFVIVKSDTQVTKTNYTPNDQILTNIFIALTLIASLFLIPFYMFSILYKHQITAWSVYAPKLLYLCFHSGMLLIVYGLVAALYF